MLLAFLYLKTRVITTIFLFLWLLRDPKPTKNQRRNAFTICLNINEPTVKRIPLDNGELVTLTWVPSAIRLSRDANNRQEII